VKRLAILAIYTSIQFTHYERSKDKPFNPMLGETFELITPEYKMLSELTCHHPPIVAQYVEGKSGYRRHSTLHPKPRFVKGTVEA
jgi:hypothetical protein